MKRQMLGLSRRIRRRNRHDDPNRMRVAAAPCGCTDDTPCATCLTANREARERIARMYIHADPDPIALAQWFDMPVARAS